MNPKYRFFLQCGNARKQASPVYGTDLSKNYSMESNQMFYRATLDGKLKFFKSDYGFIISFPFDSVYFVTVEMSLDDGKSWFEYFRGKFMRTDCAFNSEEAWAETSLTPVDNYDNILAGLDKEFNLIELAPEIQSVELLKRPAVQVYVTDTDVVTTFIGGTYFEQQSTGRYTNDDMEKFHFELQRRITYINIGTSGSGESGYEGHYYKLNDKEYISLETRVKIVLEESTVYAYYDPTGDGVYSVLLSSDGYYTNVDGLTYLHFNAARQSDGKIFTHNSSKLNDGGIEYASVYARLISDVESENWPTHEIPADDIVENNRNYRRCLGINIDSNIMMSMQLSSSPTEWGVFQPGLYYVKPKNVYTSQFYPIGRSSWSVFSLWMTPFGLEHINSKEASERYTLRDAYPLWSCIDVLLKQVAPELAFNYSSSSFLNQKGNGYTDINPVSKIAFETLITQKTNLLKGEYDQPAQKAMVTLKQMFNMLKSCFQCYWFIDGDELRVEHISYFQNGLRYPEWDGSPELAKDLTAMIHPRTLKPWSFGQSEYSFEKENMPAWYQFEWGDDVTFPFKGYPIEVLSNYVKKDNTETIAVNKFVSDIDLMLLNPSAFSEDGFALMLAVRDETDSGLSLPIVSRTIGTDKYDMQNGYAAFCDLQERYYLNSMPASRVSINKATRTVKPTRGKVQDVEFPAGDSDPDIYGLVKTSIGSGQIKDLRISLSSRFAKATLLHDTE